MNQGSFPHAHSGQFWGNFHCFQVQSQSQNGKGDFCHSGWRGFDTVKNLRREPGRISQQSNEISYIHTHFNVQVLLQLLRAPRRLVLWKAEFLPWPHHPWTSLLGSSLPWALVFIWIMGPSLTGLADLWDTWGSFCVVSSCWFCPWGQNNSLLLGREGRPWELCLGWGMLLALTICVCFAVSGKVVHLSYVWCPPEQTPLLPLLCLLWLFYQETYSRAREDKATQLRWVLIPMVLIILTVIPLHSRPAKWYFLVVTSLGR